MRDEVAARISKPIRDLQSSFMLDSATYEYGNGLGFDGLDFYVCGRGGVLGAVDAAVVSAALVFFNPSMVRQRWERGRRVMPATRAAHEFAGCLYRWSSTHLDSGLDYEALAGLLGRVVSAANPAAAPLFAGWGTLPEPADPLSLAVHRMNALCELRAALHGAMVLAAGLDPVVALLVQTPLMACVFGWAEPFPDVGLAKDASAFAEKQTDRAMARVLGALGEHEQSRLLRLLEEVDAGVN